MAENAIHLNRRLRREGMGKRGRERKSEGEKHPSQRVLDIRQRLSAASSGTLLMGKEQEGTALGRIIIKVRGEKALDIAGFEARNYGTK